MKNTTIELFKEQLHIRAVAMDLGLDIRREAGSHLEAWPCPGGHESKSKTCFHLLEDKNAFRCHNCNESGDVLSLIAWAITGNKKDFHRAIEWACHQYQLPHPWKEETPEQRTRREKRYKETQDVRAVLKDACIFWHTKLCDDARSVLSSASDSSASKSSELKTAT